MRDVFSGSLRHYRGAWIAAGVLVVAAAVDTSLWLGVEQRRVDVLEERLLRMRVAREAAREAAVRKGQEERETAALERLDRAGLLPAVETVAGLRRTVEANGVRVARIDASERTKDGALGVVRVRVTGSARYRELRRLLAELESRSDPIGWHAFTFDGSSVSIELTVLCREET